MRIIFVRKQTRLNIPVLESLRIVVIKLRACMYLCKIKKCRNGQDAYTKMYTKYPTNNSRRKRLYVDSL